MPGNNIDPNTPACGSEHDSVFCCSGQIDEVFLIGIHSSQQSWEWSEPGANCAYRNWAPSQGSGKNTCAGLRGDKYWHETACETRRPYVCSYSDVTKRTENEPGRVSLWYETTTPTVDFRRLRRRRLRRDLAELKNELKNEFWGLSTWNVSTEVRNGRNTSRGCGWLQMTHVQPTANVNLFTPLATNNGTAQSSTSLYMYTDRNGWLLSSKILADLTVDPGPGVIFASSYRHSSAVLDYCDGVSLSNANDPNDAAIVTLSYKSESLDNATGYDPDKPGIYACAGPGIPQSPVPLDESISFEIQSKSWRSNHTSWNEANRICKQSGSRMCTLAELCPSHSPGHRSEAAFRHPTKDDAWVPFADAVDNWVQLGKSSHASHVPHTSRNLFCWHEQAVHR